MPDRDLVSFSALISAQTRSRNPRAALSLFARLRREHLCPNHFVFSASVRACPDLRAGLDPARQTHAAAIVAGFEEDPFVRTSLVDAYATFGELGSAVSVFFRGPIDDPVLVSSMVSAFVGSGCFGEAIELFVETLRNLDVGPIGGALVGLVKACAGLDREIGLQMHGVCVKVGVDSDRFVGTSLVDMYGEFGDMDGMRTAFEAMHLVDLASYNALMVGFTYNGFDHAVLRLLGELRSRGFRPNECTLSSALKACGGLACLKSGKTLHGFVLKSEYFKDLVVNTALIDMYMKCERVAEGCVVFDRMEEKSVVSYNSMIFGLGQHGHHEEAVELFVEMNRRGLQADPTTLVALVSSCSAHEEAAFAHAVKHGFGSDFAVQNVVLDGLIKRGSVDEARAFFEAMRDRTVVSWTTLVSGLSHLGMYAHALEVFKDMAREGAHRPNSFTYSSALKACGGLASLEQGRSIHGCVIKHGLTNDVVTESALIDMYSKCGALKEGSRVFEESPKSNVVPWNTMISGLAQHGLGQDALELYRTMGAFGVEPNRVTFVSLLVGCSRCGLVEEGVRLFDSMREKHGLMPVMEHYVCVVDMLGRAGLLKRARGFIEDAGLGGDGSVWTVLLAACGMHGDVEMAGEVMGRLEAVGWEDGPAFVVVSNVCAGVGRWDEAEGVRSRMRGGGGGGRGAGGGGGFKQLGLSWVQTVGG
ncbi:Pentatricopeptide repeat-containing protein [Acorus gramineus]|uniref:Pentatricopeptide repeat-containing protein n=1 Tax=Acorus gramineus TaxID=55184 RepID=A0AAV9AYS0_ACOGR|nr:Pentatricopeptide repeat-containing protein [Acorus gramineus]